MKEIKCRQLAEILLGESKPEVALKKQKKKHIYASSKER